MTLYLKVIVALCVFRDVRQEGDFTHTGVPPFPKEKKFIVRILNYHGNMSKGSLRSDQSMNDTLKPFNELGRLRGK